MHHLEAHRRSNDGPKKRSNFGARDLLQLPSAAAGKASRYAPYLAYQLTSSELCPLFRPPGQRRPTADWTPDQRCSRSVFIVLAQHAEDARTMMILLMSRRGGANAGSEGVSRDDGLL